MQLLITVLLLDALLLFLLPVFRLWRSRQARQAEKAEAKVRNAIEVAADEKQLRRKPFTSLKAVFSGLLAMSNNSELPSALNSTIQLIIQKKHIQRKLRRRLSSFQASKRKQAIIFCRLLADEQRFELLTGRLEHEPKAYLRLRIAAILLESDWKGEQQAAKLIMAIVRSFEDAPEFYKTRIVALLNTRADLVARWILSLSKLPSDTWSRIVLLQGLAALPDQQAHHILLEAINSKDSTLSEAGIQIAERWYNDILTSPELQNHFSPKVRAAWSLATLKKCPLSNSNTWLQLLAQAESRKLAISMISSKIDYSTLPSVVSLYIGLMTHRDHDLRLSVAGILAPFLSHLLQFGLPLDSSIRISEEDEKNILQSLISDAVSQNQGAGFISFLNSQAKSHALSKWFELVNKLRLEYPEFSLDCQKYLDAKARQRMRIPSPERNWERPSLPLSTKDRSLLFGIITTAICFFPLAYFLSELFTPLPAPSLAGLLGFLQTSLIWYFGAVNIFYLILLVLSAIHAAVREKHSQQDETRLLFLPKMLPKVSILVPAYNEEKNIVDSIRSLLALRYPDYEIIVINDGSKDTTLQQVVRSFSMESTPIIKETVLQTAPVWTTYRSREYPELRLIDKGNGGKADSLNAGINIARGEYICSIDADSLLEQDSLLRLMSVLLDSDTETAAVGGNVLPVNSCRVRHGQIQSYHLPRNPLALFQNLEYLRAFIGGRMGWALTGSLLIISGAFGVFRRDRIIRIGGYLTGEGRYRRETVGEDMELVVRLRRNLFDRKIKHRVQYQHTASCWTEAPEKLKGLLSQRDRWQRGLIEILIYHRKMLAAVRYRAVGLWALPYFYLFELFGPIWSSFGYFILILSIIAGLLPASSIWLLLAVSVGLGIAVSAATLLLVDRSVIQYSPRDVAISLFGVIAENLGYQQLISFHRAFSTLRFVFRDAGWQKIERKGFRQG